MAFSFEPFLAISAGHFMAVSAGPEQIIMRVDPFNSREAQNLLDELHVWCAEREKYRNGEISKDDYDKWRYNYPKYTNVNYAKASSQELSEAMAEAFKDKLNKD